MSNKVYVRPHQRKSFFQDGKLTNPAARTRPGRRVNTNVVHKGRLGGKGDPFRAHTHDDWRKRKEYEGYANHIIREYYDIPEDQPMFVKYGYQWSDFDHGAWKWYHRFDILNYEELQEKGYGVDHYYDIPFGELK